MKANCPTCGKPGYRPTVFHTWMLSAERRAFVQVRIYGDIKPEDASLFDQNLRYISNALRETDETREAP